MIVERQWLEAVLQSGEEGEYLARRMRYDHNEKEIWFWRMFANKEVSPYKSYHVVGFPKTRGKIKKTRTLNWNSKDSLFWTETDVFGVNVPTLQSRLRSHHNPNNRGWLPSLKNNAHAYIHKNKIKLWNFFIYKKPDTFQKARQFPLSFYIQKAIHLTLRDFHEFFEVGIFIQKSWHFALRDVFIYKNLDTSQKAR